MPRIHFIDVTNRDAVQASRMSLAKLQKTMVNMYLAEMGVHQSEFSFPAVRHERNYVQGNLELRDMGAMGSLVLEGWCRAIASDVTQSLETGVRDLNISISTSEQMVRGKFRGKLGKDAVIDEMMAAARCARTGGAASLGVNSEDSSRTEMGYLVEFAHAAKEAGADRFRYCDTVGYDTPKSIYERVRRLAEEVGTPVELHCHNDLGLAVANSVAGAQAAIDGGVDAYINTSVNGVGERAGQADLLSCLLVLNFGRDMEAYHIGDPIKLRVAARLAGYVSAAFGVPIAMNQPGVGANVFAHEAGIHADGFLKDRRNYELFHREILGVGDDVHVSAGRVITTGEFGGLAGLRHVYEGIGITLPDDATARRVLELVQIASAHTQLPLTDDELRLIAAYQDQVRKILTVTPGQPGNPPGADIESAS
jgi:isopropylmalate/homocitrate/citramalate synthase